MILTEEEAKTKRCQESYGDTNLGSGYISTSPQLCIGSACMAWRWRFPHSSDEHDMLLGYCGKAGRPWT